MFIFLFFFSAFVIGFLSIRTNNRRALSLSYLKNDAIEIIKNICCHKTDKFIISRRKGYYGYYDVYITQENIILDRPQIGVTKNIPFVISRNNNVPIDFPKMAGIFRIINISKDTKNRLIIKLENMKVQDHKVTFEMDRPYPKLEKYFNLFIG